MRRANIFFDGLHCCPQGVTDRIRPFDPTPQQLQLDALQIYARANLEMKRRALEKVAGDSPSAALPSWQQSKSLLDWLRSL